MNYDYELEKQNHPENFLRSWEEEEEEDQEEYVPFLEPERWEDA